MKLMNILKEVTGKYLLRNTKGGYKQRGKDLSIKLLTKTKKGRYVFRVTNKKNGNIYKTYIQPVYPNKEIKSLSDDVIVHCDCDDFKYRNEYVLWKANASHRLQATNEPPKITNPENIKKVCKHLVVSLKYLRLKINDTSRYE